MSGAIARPTCRIATTAFQGETLTIGQWSERTGIAPGTIWKRLNSGWTPEKALTSEVRNQNTRIVSSRSVSQIASETGLSVSAIYNRFRRGWDEERLGIERQR